MSDAMSAQFPVLSLLHPRRYTKFMLGALVVGLLVGVYAAQQWAYPKWAVTALILMIWLPIAIAKWRSHLLYYGSTLTILDILLTAQGLHTIEHIVQWAQYYLFGWTLRQSNGLLSPANAEWVHFVWNWLVLAAVLLLIRGGIRNLWGWALLAVASLHTAEHTYLFVRYQWVLRDLQQLGITEVTAQGLPGILGRDGWLARSIFTQGTIICRAPGLTTATRLDVHFWWNVIEMTLLTLAAHRYLRHTLFLTHNDTHEQHRK